MVPLSVAATNELQTHSFRILTAAQVDRVLAWGNRREVRSGEILIEPHEINPPFFVVLSGSIEIVQRALNGEQVIATHGPNQFTGELTTISGQRSLVRARVLEGGTVIEVKAEGLRSLVDRNSDLSEILLRAFIMRRLGMVSAGQGNVVLLGSRHSARTLELQEFLSRNRHPYKYIDLDADDASQEVLERFHVTTSEIPVVICDGVNVLRSPSIQDLADCLGLNSHIDSANVRDLIIVGAGPAGLAAAVYAASEGLSTVVIETHAPGGQAGSSSRIENYLGFPMGVSGQELASRATTQACKFGTDMMIARSIVRLDCDWRPYGVVLDSGETMLGRAIVIATGAHYNKPVLTNLEKFEGDGIYYGATHIESQLCEGDEVTVIGGGNSAGQAAVFLGQAARRVYMLVRSGELSCTMSRYLIQRLIENPKIELHMNTEITSVEGVNSLERIFWRNNKTGEVKTLAVQHVFVMAGASPKTDWLRGCVALDENGFILTGRDLESRGARPENPSWPLERSPQMLETSLPGVFAVGDVRAGSVKRVASAVGEGAISIHMVHKALAQLCSFVRF
jgi:thioredoxin reductase (NADPH)